jgi:4-alpha-glucanotransferase
MGELRDRKTGILMHVSSLPGRCGAGTFGEPASRFARIVAGAGVSSWQTLPLVPTSAATAHSPYSSPSAFAGNIVFIDPDKLAETGLIAPETLDKFALPSSGAADFDRALASRREILNICYRNFRDGDAYRTKFRALSGRFWDFCAAEAYWLEDYALFSVLKEIEEGRSWGEWRPEFRRRDWDVLDRMKLDSGVAAALDERRFGQFLFFTQLRELREECAALGVQLIGDLPIYVAYDSADVWGHQELFELGPDGAPASVAGVPPDYFSPAGQRWGNPIYRWEKMREDNYAWWMGRFRHALEQADVVRIDHFRGFLQYWEIPADEETAVNGRWAPGPGAQLFQTMRSFFADETGRTPFIAEDLGVRTDDVVQAMEDFALPGMKVLHFAFGDGMSDNPYIPHNHRRGSVVYAGTHDNDTTMGWWSASSAERERANFARYAGLDNPSAMEATDAMLRMTLSSTADLAVITAQDVLRLGAEARMNTPSTVAGNWTWRMTDLGEFEREMGRVSEWSELFGRSHPSPGKPVEEGINQNGEEM